MKRIYLGSLAGALLLLLSVTRASALPLIAVDMDPTTAGIQSSLTVQPGDTFTIDVVYTGDGLATFDTVILDVAFNDAGPVLALGPGPTPGAPTAGSLAGTTPFPVVNLFGFALVVPGGALTPDSIPLASGFTGGIGGVGLFTFPPFPLFGAGVEIDIFSLDFVAAAPGASTVLATGIPFFGANLALGLLGDGVPVSLTPGSVNVVPEPGTVVLMASGLAGLGLMRRKLKAKSL